MSKRLPVLLTVVVAAVVTWQFAPAAATVPYDIVYVRAPRSGGDTQQSRIPDVFRPMWLEPKSDLVLLHADGNEEVLVAGGEKGAVTDPCVSFDGQWVYYAYAPDVTQLIPFVQFVPSKGSDIYKINLVSRKVIQLTHGEYTPSAAGPAQPGVPVYNMGPCPAATGDGPRIVFTSNRNGFGPTKGYTSTTEQLYVMREDGSDVEAIAPMTLGSALHPFQLKDGRIAFSSYESQGLRDQRSWGLWAIWPDGRKWEPLMSSFSGDDAVHFAAETSNSTIVAEVYYNLNNSGFGWFIGFPARSPTAPINFGPAANAQNVGLTTTSTASGRTSNLRFAFQPIGAFAVTPFTHPVDEAAPLVNGVRTGKVTMPSGAPGNDLLLVWSPGPVNLLQRPVNTPAADAGIYVARNSYADTPNDLVLVKNDPAYNELWPRAVVPYKTIYGVDAPHEFPFLPNDGSAHPSLPAGTPYGIIGTSSFYKRESAPGYTRVSQDGLDPFNSFVEQGNSNWIWQGADVGRYSNEEIAAVRILAMEPRSAVFTPQTWFNHANERLRILGEIPLRKFAADGSPVRDAEGNPDTSFWARVPADTPITFQMIDSHGRNLTMAQTWHQVRPGEVRVDCGGCHAHSVKPLEFDGTAASKAPPADLTLQPAHDIEFVRDIRPILQAKCVTCHRGAAAPANGLRFDLTDLVAPVSPDTGRTLPRDYAVLARNAAAAYGGYKAILPANKFWYSTLNGSRYVRKFQSRRSLLVWKLAGARLDGWTNSRWPTEGSAGDASTFPAGADANLADLDYGDTAHHEALLTEAEQRLIATWIDIGAPIDLGGGYWQDETRPALALTLQGNTLLIGLADAYSGVVPESLSVTVNDRTAAVQPMGDGRWRATTPLTLPARIVARVRDHAGNWTERRVQFGSGASVGPTPTLAPRPPTGVRVQ